MRGFLLLGNLYRALPVRLRVPQLPRHSVEVWPELPPALRPANVWTTKISRGMFSLHRHGPQTIRLVHPDSLELTSARTMGPTNLDYSERLELSKSGFAIRRLGLFGIP